MILKYLNKVKQLWDLIFVLLIFWVLMLYLLLNPFFLNLGFIVYPLDDTYTHMAISKNISQYGIWGSNKYGFTSNSSSLLYTLILSFSFIIAGVNQIIPLILNLFFANILICIIYKILKDRNIPSYGIILGLLSMIIFTPLTFLVVIGMEFVLQIALNIVFIFVVSNYLNNEQSLNGNKQSFRIKLIILIAPLVTMIRFEGMFIIVIVMILFVLKKSFKSSFYITIFGFSPLIIYGFISILNGWSFLPNSILLKTDLPNISDFSNFFLNFMGNLFNRLFFSPHILILIVIMSVIFCYEIFLKKGIWNELCLMSIIFISITLLQIQFAAIGFQNFYFLRYETHIIALGILIIILSIKDFTIYLEKMNIHVRKKKEEISLFFEKAYIPQLLSLALIISIVIIQFSYRTDYILKLYPKSSKNIYEQQYQMGLFLKQYYNGECIAANDIGAINFLADIKCIDLWGLGTMEIANAKIKGTYDTYTIMEITSQNNCQIAIIYDWAFMSFKGWPPDWVKVGEWTITENVICAGDTVSFYAVNPSEVNNLIANLKEFSSRLPDDIIESGMYILNS